MKSLELEDGTFEPMEKPRRYDSMFESKFCDVFTYGLFTPQRGERYEGTGFKTTDISGYLWDCLVASTGEIDTQRLFLVASGSDLSEVSRMVSEAFEVFPEAKKYDPKFPKNLRPDLSRIADPEDPTFDVGKYGPNSTDNNFVLLRYIKWPEESRTPKNVIYAKVRLPSTKGTSVMTGELFVGPAGLLNRIDVFIESQGREYNMRAYRRKKGGDLELSQLVRNSGRGAKWHREILFDRRNA
ncbi:MAG: hypothetical protein PUE38_04275 [Olsenella sp.]|nr:hypothetical protein [Olsenella sp.]